MITRREVTMATEDLKPSPSPMTTTTVAKLEKHFSQIILTLENVLIASEKVAKTPSIDDGLDGETEKDLRILGTELIQIAGMLLKLPQTAMATGCVLFQRFYYSKSFVRHTMEIGGNRLFERDAKRFVSRYSLMFDLQGGLSA